MKEYVNKIQQFEIDILNLKENRKQFIKDLFIGKVLRWKTNNNMLIKVISVLQVDSYFCEFKYEYIENNIVLKHKYVIHYSDMEESFEFALPVEWNTQLNDLLNHYKQYEVKDINLIPV